VFQDLAELKEIEVNVFTIAALAHNEEFLQGDDG
jgi:hypothetical protein